MKIIAAIQRIILGVVFVVSGLYLRSMALFACISRLSGSSPVF